MGIWDRLGNVVKSYFNDDNEKIRWRSPGGERADPDLNAAYDELDDFLKEGSAKEKPGGKASGREADGEQDWATPGNRVIPAELQEDFAALGLTPGATAEECKEAYKKLLKIHHPDRHTRNPANMKKATEKTAQINAAYGRLEKWFREQ
jgi:DnaJ-domain-containing protein 1